MPVRRNEALKGFALDRNLLIANKMCCKARVKIKGCKNQMEDSYLIASEKAKKMPGQKFRAGNRRCRSRARKGVEFFAYIHGLTAAATGFLKALANPVGKAVAILGEVSPIAGLLLHGRDMLVSAGSTNFPPPA
jgi:hypothetical protein